MPPQGHSLELKGWVFAIGDVPSATMGLASPSKDSP